MNEFRLTSNQNGITLKSKVNSYNFSDLSSQEAFTRLGSMNYAQYHTLIEPFGDGEISVFVENDPFYLSFKSLLTYFPISSYFTLLSVYFILFTLPAEMKLSDMIQVYLNVLSGVTFQDGGQFLLSYLSMMVFWVVSGGMISLIVVAPIYTFLMRFFSILPSIVYRFLYYKVLGLFVRTGPDSV